jgi:hypothetical protein
MGGFAHRMLAHHNTHNSFYCALPLPPNQETFPVQMLRAISPFAITNYAFFAHGVTSPPKFTSSESTCDEGGTSRVKDNATSVTSFTFIVCDAPVANVIFVTHVVLFRLEHCRIVCDYPGFVFAFVPSALLPE